MYFVTEHWVLIEEFLYCIKSNDDNISEISPNIGNIAIFLAPENIAIFPSYRWYLGKISLDDIIYRWSCYAAARKRKNHFFSSFLFLSVGEGRGRVLWWLSRRVWGSNNDYHHQLRFFCGSKIEEQWDKLHFFH